MMMLLFSIAIGGGFDWQAIEKQGIQEIYEEIQNSSVVGRYGKQNLERWYIYLTSDVFGGGCMIVLSKGTQIRRIPDNLKIVNSGIKMKKFDRYVALYNKRGELKREWKKLERESAKKLGISSLSFEELKRFLPDENYKEGTGAMNAGFEKIESIEFPAKTYYSFMEIEENRTRKLIPVVMELCPIAEKIEEYVNRSKGGG
jgi:hypothetical protein